jgi:hypothetical protein
MSDNRYYVKYDGQSYLLAPLRSHLNDLDMP